jgi:hypothetical protein
MVPRRAIGAGTPGGDRTGALRGQITASGQQVTWKAFKITGGKFKGLPAAASYRVISLPTDVVNNLGANTHLPQPRLQTGVFPLSGGALTGLRLRGDSSKWKVVKTAR